MVATVEVFIVDLKDQLGILYVYGGDTPQQGFDCSGLEVYCADLQDVVLPRTTQAMWQSALARTNNLRAIWISPDPNVVQPTEEALANAIVGDILEFNVPSDGGVQPQHTGVYLGDGMMIQAPETFIAPGVRGRVCISPVPNDPDVFLMGVARITAFATAPPPLPPAPEGDEDMAITAFEDSKGNVHCFGVSSNPKVGVGHLLHASVAAGQPESTVSWIDWTGEALKAFPEAGPYTVEP